MSTPTFVERGAGARHEMIDGTHVVKAGSEATDGAYEVFEVLAARGPAAPLHASPWTGTLYLLEGRVRVITAAESYDLGPGAAFSAPGGTRFTFEVASDTARFLAVTSGDGAGRFFADFASSVPAGGPLEEALPHVLAVTGRHGVTVG